MTETPPRAGFFPSVFRGMQMSQAKAAYSRILVKLSGEALMGEGDYGIEPAVIKRIAGELHEIVQMGVQLAVVIGGGNIFRGAGLARAGMDRTTSAAAQCATWRRGASPSSPPVPVTRSSLPIRRRRCVPSRSTPMCC
jgi:hypothetical protein